MTKQIKDLLDDIGFNFNEDDSVILKTYIQRLEATIEPQEIIIKDMAQPKTCEECIHYEEWISALGKMGVGDCLHDIAREIVCAEVPKVFCCNYYEQKVQP